MAGKAKAQEVTGAETLHFLGSTGFAVMSLNTLAYIWASLSNMTRVRQRGMIICAATTALVLGTTAVIRFLVFAPLTVFSVSDGATLSGIMTIMYLGAQVGGLLRIHRDA